MSLPVIALVGRPNVGKSTLFNRLTRSRDALVDDQPGVTRDRLYGIGQSDQYRYLVVDTGGIESEETQFSAQILRQVEMVMDEADFILFMVDHKHGLVSDDQTIADKLRKSNCKVLLVVNKSEGLDENLAVSEFQELALGAPKAISAKRGDGVADLIADLLSDWHYQDVADDDQSLKVAIVGRPNVGKSTTVNQIVGDERVIVSDQPGTTRDSVFIPITYKDQAITIIDTAGVRRKAKVDEAIEKFSVIKTLKAIEQAQVVILMVDGAEKITTQDIHIAGMVNEMGRSIALIINKWDRLPAEQKKRIKNEVRDKFPFLVNPETICISAKYGSNVRKVLPAAMKAAASAVFEFTTSSLNRTLDEATTYAAPPMHQGRPVRLKFAHQAGKNPPVIVVHGSQAETIPVSYRRYLANFFATQYRLRGTPIRIIPRTTQNPFRNKKKVATRRGRKRRD